MEGGEEDAMLKLIHENIERKASKKIKKTEHELKIEQADGGFFEKFNSLARQYSVKDSSESSKLPKLDTRSLFLDELPAAEYGEKSTDQNEEQNSKIPEGEQSDIEQPESDFENSEQAKPDSDTESESSKFAENSVRETSDFVQVGWNIDELYLEILYEILHNIGCDDASEEISQISLFSYLQEAFKMSNEKHTELLTNAEQKEAPEILLNVEIVEAKELIAKDSNGLSDPFVTLYLLSNPTHKYNTSVKDCTLSPMWEEHFALQIADNISDDTLCLEVWDFDPAETVREKMSKVGQIKGVKGLRKLVKEIAMTITTGEHENELIGKTNVPLKNIPASGLTMWYGLEKKNKLNRRGLLKIRLAFSSEKNSQVACQEHRHLLKILLLHELELSKVTEYYWCGNFSKQAESILTQHGVQSGLSQTNLAFAQWAVFCSVHLEHPLSFALFVSLLEKLTKPLQTSTSCDEDVKYFWDGTKKLLPSCFTIIRKIRKKTSNDKNMMKQLVEVLKILGRLATLEPPENYEMFPENAYPWLPRSDNNPTSWDLTHVLKEAIFHGTLHWFNHVLENNLTEVQDEEERLHQLIRTIQLVRTDLQRAIELYDKIFQENVNLQYAKTLYCIYEEKLAVLVEPEVRKICESENFIFPGHIYPGRGPVVDPTTPLAVGTALFELYLILQRFVVLGTGLCPTEYETFKINNFHLWFHGGVARWLNIAVYKTMLIIRKAIEVDNLQTVDATVKYSSSAVDTLTTFYQVKTFWQQLNWPDIESSYSFIAKIIDDLCRCCVYFAEQTQDRVSEMGCSKDSNNCDQFEVVGERCLAINNIDYMMQSLKPFTDELGVNELIQQLSDLRSPMEAERCKQTLENVIDNAMDTVRNKLVEMLEAIAQKMCPMMKKLLIEGAEILHQDSNSIDKVMRYLDTNLATLYEYLNDENFSRMLEVFWGTLSKILYDIYQSNLDKRRPPSFFANLHETLKLMVGCFKQNQDQQNQDTGDCEDLKRIEHLLAMNGMETHDLIHQVQLERWREQKDIKNSPFGQLTIKIKFDGNRLQIDVMNARNLKPMDSNGLTDSFIRIHLLPEEKFTSVPKPKTKVHYKTLFPLYDEKFTIELTPEQRSLTNGLVLFSVKDNNLLMSNQYIAEAYVHFLEIPATSEPLQNVPQTMLELHRPTITDNDAIRALEHRQGEKLAREFVKKHKQKIGLPTK